ncbi:MAG: hypothetical protein MUF54_26105 [Polyangiaceae bacterium]|nr:hypothetical protein [Polyangiaceae bacterium]
MSELNPGQGYDELLDDTEVVSDGCIDIRVLSLEKLVEVKAAAGRAKDRLAIPLLVATLEERAKRDADGGDAT